MMNTLIAMFVNSKAVKMIQAVQGFLSGKKTYITAFSAAVVAIANLLQQFSALPNTTDTVSWVRHLTGNTDALVLYHSLIVLTMRAAISKSGPIEPVINSKDGPTNG